MTHEHEMDLWFHGRAEVRAGGYGGRQGAHEAGKAPWRALSLKLVG